MHIRRPPPPLAIDRSGFAGSNSEKDFRTASVISSACRGWCRPPLGRRATTVARPDTNGSKSPGYTIFAPLTGREENNSTHTLTLSGTSLGGPRAEHASGVVIAPRLLDKPWRLARLLLLLHPRSLDDRQLPPGAQSLVRCLLTPATGLASTSNVSYIMSTNGVGKEGLCTSHRTLIPSN